MIKEKFKATSHHLKYKYSRRNKTDKKTIIGACWEKLKQVHKSCVQAKTVGENTFGKLRVNMKRRNKKEHVINYPKLE